MTEAQVYFYQERQERRPDGRIPKIVGAELVLENVLLSTATTTLDGLNMKTTGEAIDALGAYIGQQAIGRGIQEYRILLYQRPTGDCLKEDEFFDVGRGEKREGKRTLSIGNDAVAHTQTHFVRGLAQGDEAKFKRLWRKLLGAPSD